MADRTFRRGRGSAVVRAPKRLSAWIASADQGFVAVAAGASVIEQSNPTLAATTIVRTRGVVSVRPSAYAADAELVGAIGFGVVSDQAFAAGAASVPGPWTDPDWDGWFVWIPYSFNFEFIDATGTLLPGTVQIPLDSKAMRKVNFNETVVVVVESQAAAIQVGVTFRMLVKLA